LYSTRQCSSCKMSTEFKIPCQAEDLESGADGQFFAIETKTDVRPMSEEAVGSLLDEVSDRLSGAAGGAQRMVDHSNFDPLFSCAFDFKELSERSKARLIEVLSDAANGLVAAATELNPNAAAAAAAPAEKKAKAKGKGKDQKADGADSDADAADGDGDDGAADAAGGSAEQKSAIRNAVKMTAYLLTSIVAAGEKAEKANSALKKKPVKAPVRTDPLHGTAWQRTALHSAHAYTALTHALVCYCARCLAVGSGQEEGRRCCEQRVRLGAREADGLQRAARSADV
jgi:hypothetical protein